MTTLVIQLYVINLKMIEFVRNKKFQAKNRAETKKMFIKKLKLNDEKISEEGPQLISYP